MTGEDVFGKKITVSLQQQRVKSSSNGTKPGNPFPPVGGNFAVPPPPRGPLLMAPSTRPGGPPTRPGGIFPPVGRIPMRPIPPGVGGPFQPPPPFGPVPPHMRPYNAHLPRLPPPLHYQRPLMPHPPLVKI